VLARPPGPAVALPVRDTLLVRVEVPPGSAAQIAMATAATAARAEAMVAILLASSHR
jgi:hypothetical protein